MKKYILENKTTVPEPNYDKWAKWIETANRAICKDTAIIKYKGEEVGRVFISTVFLGTDYSCYGGPPQLFETMVFGGILDGEQERCSTWGEAEQMHKLMCERVKQATAEVAE